MTHNFLKYSFSARLHHRPIINPAKKAVVHWYELVFTEEAVRRIEAFYWLAPT